MRLRRPTTFRGWLGVGCGGALALFCAVSVLLGVLRGTGQAIGIIPTNTPVPTRTAPPTPAPTETPGPTNTPAPTDTARPTRTPEPTNTPRATSTPRPPTETPDPAVTAAALATREAIAADIAFPCEPGQIKANIDSGIFHAPGQQFYRRTRNNVRCFDTIAEARTAGFLPSEK